MNFPTAEEELLQTSASFQKVSTVGIISASVGCVDGLSLKKMTPSSKETGNVKACCSGCHSTHGINVQGVCNSSFWVTCVAVVTSGSCNDCQACEESDLPASVDALPTGACIIGDNAHPVSEKLLMPFSGTEAHDEMKWNCNFFV